MAFRIFRRRTAGQRQAEIDAAHRFVKAGGVLVCIPVALLAFGLASPIFMPLMMLIAMPFGLVAAWVLLHGTREMLVARTYGQRNAFFIAICVFLAVGLAAMMARSDFLRELMR